MHAIAQAKGRSVKVLIFVFLIHILKPKAPPPGKHFINKCPRRRGIRRRRTPARLTDARQREKRARTTPAAAARRRCRVVKIYGTARMRSRALRRSLLLYVITLRARVAVTTGHGAA